MSYNYDDDGYYGISLNTEEGNDYLSDFLDEPLEPGTDVNILFEFKTGRCSFDFTDPDGFGSPEGFEDDWEGCVDWLRKNGYAEDAAEITRLAEEWGTFEDDDLEY